ncbi:hypothetical protein GGD87_003764 [Rhodobaca bogoriensis DSM 18756]|nr:hypothetical protein [Rhodobaca bogoriensis DSM 18756]
MDDFNLHNPGPEAVLAHAPIIRAFRTVVDYLPVSGLIR